VYRVLRRTTGEYIATHKRPDVAARHVAGRPVIEDRGFGRPGSPRFRVWTGATSTEHETKEGARKAVKAARAELAKRTRPARRCETRRPSTYPSSNERENT
jgi:hypothetical protein